MSIPTPSARWRAACALLCWLALALAPRAQTPAEFTSVEVHITALSPASIYLDRGSDSGLAAGDRVRLYPDGAPLVDAVVRSVSKQSARAEWDGLAPGLAVGLRGEAMVPTERLQQLAQGQGAESHPAWQQSLDGWDTQQPLLAAPDFAKQRASEFALHGRVFWQYDHTLDAQSDNQFSFGRAGADLRLENPFGRPGALELEGEFEQRLALSSGSDDESLQQGRVQRLSYHTGDELDAPLRWELGRFPQHEFPELGAIDGAEVVFRRSSLDRWGASAGLFPSYTPDMSTGEDAQLALFYRHLFKADESASLGAAYQKTFHQGEADRDLLVLDGRYFAPGALFATGTAWIDYYDAGDDPKSSGFELTQLFLSANKPLGKDAGLGASASFVRFPQMLHDELSASITESLLDQHVQRLSLNGWRNLRADLRLNGRADVWSDQDDSGGSAELGLRWRRALWKRVDLSAALFGSDGKYSALTGLRLGANAAFERGSWSLNYEIADSSVDSGGSDAGLLQQALRASLDFALGQRWSLSAYLEDRFGDEQDSLAAGLYLTRRL